MFAVITLVWLVLMACSSIRAMHIFNPLPVCYVIWSCLGHASVPAEGVITARHTL